MLDHALERPGLRARLQRQRGVEIEAIFALDMGANEGGIGDALALVVDERQLPLGRGRRHRPFLAIGKTRHLELDFGLGHKRADFRQAEAGAKAIKRDHAKSPDLLKWPCRA